MCSWLTAVSQQDPLCAERGSSWEERKYKQSRKQYVQIGSTLEEELLLRLHDVEMLYSLICLFLDSLEFLYPGEIFWFFLGGNLVTLFLLLNIWCTIVVIVRRWKQFFPPSPDGRKAEARVISSPVLFEVFLLISPLYFPFRLPLNLWVFGCWLTSNFYLFLQQWLGDGAGT